MKKLYESPCHRAYIRIVDFHDGDAEVQTVYTVKPCRGRGLMRPVFQEMLDDADREGVVLLLNVRTGPGYDELVKWYERRGFDSLGGNRMQRAPGAGRAMEIMEQYKATEVERG